MSSQRLFQLLLGLIIAETAGAIWIWRTTAELPPSWLNRAIIVTAVLASIVFMISDTLRPRLMLRFLASLFALIAVIAFTADVSHPGAAGGLKATSLMAHWNDFAPSLLASTRASFARSGAAFLFDPVMTTILSYPTFLLFSALALIAGLASRPRREIRIFVN
jgi:hypothetical protein